MPDPITLSPESSVHFTEDGLPFVQFSTVAAFSQHYGYDESLKALNDHVRQVHLQLVKRKIKESTAAGEAGIATETLVESVTAQRFGKRQRQKAAKAPSVRKRLAAIPKDKLADILARIEAGEL